MIKAVTNSTNGTPVVFLGLSRRNTELLLEGKPIPVDLRLLDPTLPELRIVLLADETEDAVGVLLGRQPTAPRAGRVIANCVCPDGDTGLHQTGPDCCWVLQGDPTRDELQARATMRGATIAFPKETP